MLGNRKGTHMPADAVMLESVQGAVTAFLTAIGVAALPAADLVAAKRAALPSLALPVQPAWGAARFCATKTFA